MIIVGVIRLNNNQDEHELHIPTLSRLALNSGVFLKLPTEFSQIKALTFVVLQKPWDQTLCDRFFAKLNKWIILRDYLLWNKIFMEPFYMKYG